MKLILGLRECAVCCLSNFFPFQVKDIVFLWCEITHRLFVCVNAVMQCVSGKLVDTSIRVSLTTKEFRLHDGSNPVILLS